MSENPLFYQNVIPLNKENHAGFTVASTQKPANFAKDTHLIPAVAEEYAAASRHFPIVFLPTEAGFASTFLCGLKPGENLFVDEVGEWSAPYVPAYMRRYPFILGERGEEDPIICIDETYDGFAEQKEGNALFGEDGELSDYMTNMIEFVRNYADAAKRTEAFCTLMTDLKLMRSITINVGGETDGATTVHGLFMVDEEKLNDLSSEDFEKIRSAGFLGAIYSHLFSIGSTALLTERLEGQNSEATTDDSAVA